MYSAVLRRLHSCTFLDIFAFDGRPLRSGDHTQSSVRGFVGTVLALCLLLAYMGNSLYRFITTPNTVMVERSGIGDDVSMEMVRTCVTLPNLTDSTYFSFNFRHVELSANMTKTAIVVDDYVVESPGRICLKTNHSDFFKLRSFCSPGNCEFIEFHLWNCGCPDPHNPTHDKSTSGNNSYCKPLTDVAHILETNYATFTYETEIATVVLDAVPKIHSATQYMSFFTYNHSIIQPDFYKTFEPHHMTNLIHSEDDYSLQWLFKRAPTKPVLEVRMVLAQNIATTTAVHATVPMLLSQWSALGQAIFAVVGAYFLWYNEELFFKKNPLWSRIGPAFNVIPEEDEVDDDGNIVRGAGSPASVAQRDANFASITGEPFLAVGDYQITQANLFGPGRSPPGTTRATSEMGSVVQNNSIARESFTTMIEHVQ